MMPVAKLASLVPPVQAAVDALARGEPVLIFDAVDRERETDLVFLSSMATPELVRLARQDAGGLICTAISNELRTRIGLPYFAELLELGEARFRVLATVRAHRPRYDRRSSFGITLNHVSTYTGVPDNDRARTIRAIGELARDAASLTDAELAERFAREFSSPGHVPLLYAAPSLLRERKGHTELAISLARMGSLAESVTVCEMLGDSGGARGPEAARHFAAERGWSFLEGRTIAEEFDRWSA
ncbi:MAG: 3,4-dihydroxy-2-butanone-4-phosphate synthase [Thermoplasmata archaeon]|nr:3,4-dihydroxy-2-butanone-4-phosphate synthase [Thermoplasmata archaeon]